MFVAAPFRQINHPSGWAITLAQLPEARKQMTANAQVSGCAWLILMNARWRGRF
jgi:hypothetical protein